MINPHDARRGESYFIANTKTGEAEIDLTRTQWTARLRALGIRQPPSLRRPTGPDGLYGYTRP